MSTNKGKVAEKIKTFFKHVRDDLYQCKLCDKVYSGKKGWNLGSHLKTMHKVIV